MAISSDWLPDEIDFYGEDEDERRQIAWAVLVLLFLGIGAALLNVFAAILW